MIDVQRWMRLPKWAQDELNLMKNNMEYYKEKLESVEGGTSDVGFDYYGHTHGRRQFLAAETQVFFMLDGQPVFVRVKPGGCMIELRGMRSLVINPVASNVIEVGQEV